MFTPAPFVKGSPNLFAFNPETVKGERAAAYHYYGGAYHLSVEAVWFSKSETTRGSLVLGKVTYAMGRNLVTPQMDLNYNDFLTLARNHDPGLVNTTGEKVGQDSRIVLSNTKIWGASGKNELEFAARAIEIWKGLPELPEGWDGWYKLSNRAPR